MFFTCGTQVLCLFYCSCMFLSSCFLILTYQWQCAKHQFAGQETQQLTKTGHWTDYFIKVKKVWIFKKSFFFLGKVQKKLICNFGNFFKLPPLIVVAKISSKLGSEITAMDRSAKTRVPNCKKSSQIIVLLGLFLSLPNLF